MDGITHRCVGVSGITRRSTTSWQSAITGGA
jgi:hypothetical protein